MITWVVPFYCGHIVQYQVIQSVATFLPRPKFIFIYPRWPKLRSEIALARLKSDFAKDQSRVSYILDPCFPIHHLTLICEITRRGVCSFSSSSSWHNNVFFGSGVWSLIVGSCSETSLQCVLSSFSYRMSAVHFSTFPFILALYNGAYFWFELNIGL